MPQQIKYLMDSIHCGTIGADPSKNNDYKTNIDYGFAIDLNDDQRPEYIFCCTQAPHGPCQANIFSMIHGSWKILYPGFDGFSNEDPMVNIRVLKTKHEGFHDLCVFDKVMTLKNGTYSEE